jgi:hypothetical protein
MVCTQGSLSDLPTRCSSEDLSNVWSSVLSSKYMYIITLSSLDIRNKLFSQRVVDCTTYISKQQENRRYKNNGITSSPRCTQGSLSDLPTRCSSEDLSNVWSSVLSSNLEIMRSSLDLDTLYSSNCLQF